MSEHLTDEQLERLVRVVTDHLALYTLPANVAAYYDSRLVENTHETVAERCGPLMAAEVADFLAQIVADAKAAGLREAAAMFEDDNLPPYSPSDVRYVLRDTAARIAREPDTDQPDTAGEEKP